MTFYAFSSVFLDLKRRNVAVTTLSSYESIISTRLIPAFGNFELNSITRLSVQLFVNSLSDDGLSSATVIRIFTVFREMLKKAVLYDLLDSIKAIENIELPRVIKREKRCLTVDECKYLFFCLRNEPLLWQAFFVTALDTGARRGELVALQWQDIDFDNSLIHIEKAAYRLKGVVGVKEPKGRASRSVFVTKRSLNLLRSLRMAQGVLDHSAFVFSADGGMMYPTSPSRWWSNFLKKTGVPHSEGMGVHILRHTCASFLLANKVPIVAVQRRLGHASMSTTFLYLHGDLEADKRARDVFEKIL